MSKDKFDVDELARLANEPEEKDIPQIEVDEYVQKISDKRNKEIDLVEGE